LELDSTIAEDLISSSLRRPGSISVDGVVRHP
jgi:hypothetical protein